MSLKIPSGGTRTDTEWDQWVNSEKEQLAKVMERFGIEWLKLDTHEEHLSVLDFKKKMRAKEVAELDEQAAEKLVTYKRRDRELQKQVDQLKNENRKKDSLIDKLKGIIDGLKKEITELKQRLSGKESLHDRLEQEKMKAENEDLKKENKILREKLALHGIPFGRKREDRNI